VSIYLFTTLTILISVCHHFIIPLTETCMCFDVLVVYISMDALMMPSGCSDQVSSQVLDWGNNRPNHTPKLFHIVFCSTIISFIFPSPISTPWNPLLFRHHPMFTRPFEIVRVTRIEGMALNVQLLTLYLHQSIEHNTYGHRLRKTRVPVQTTMPFVFSFFFLGSQFVDFSIQFQYLNPANYILGSRFSTQTAKLQQSTAPLGTRTRLS
jgi:hypothetical protein